MNNEQKKAERFVFVPGSLVPIKQPKPWEPPKPPTPDGKV